MNDWNVGPEDFRGSDFTTEVDLREVTAVMQHEAADAARAEDEEDELATVEAIAKLDTIPCYCWRCSAEQLGAPVPVMVEWARGEPWSCWCCGEDPELVEAGPCDIEPQREHSKERTPAMFFGTGAIGQAREDVQRAYKSLTSKGPVRRALRTVGDAGAALAELMYAAAFESGREVGDSDARQRVAQRNFDAQLSGHERTRIAVLDAADLRVRQHFAQVLGLGENAQWSTILQRFEAMQESMRLFAQWAVSDATGSREQLARLLGALPQAEEVR